MLLSRVLTGLALAAIVVLVTLYSPPVVYTLTFGAFAAIGIYEWAGFLRLEKTLQRLGYVGAFVLVAAIVHLNEELRLPLLYLVGLVWVGAVISVLVYPRSRGLFLQRWFAALLGLVVVTGAWLGLVLVMAAPDGRLWLIWLLFLTSATDIGAFFSGRAWGKRLLAPNVSPGKTWAGAVGGTTLAIVVCGGAIVAWREEPVGWLAAMLGLIVLAIFGDLFESVLKRANGLKDSGNILPGHGGILDRMDSLIAVAPMMALLLWVR